MIRIFLFFIFLFPYFVPAQATENRPGWELLFSDDFDSLNLNHWRVENNSDGYASNRPFPAFNRLLVRTSRKENIRCENGNLILTVRHENYSCPEEDLNKYGCSSQAQTGKSYTFTSSLIASKVAYQYGLFETRAKVSDVWGLNSAFWLLSETNPYQEVDIFEMIPGANPVFCPKLHDKGMSTCNWHIDGGAQGTTEGQTTVATVEDYTQFHNYALEWTPTRLIFYIDGKVVRNIDHSGRLNSPENILFSIGFSDYLRPKGSDFPASMVIDWVNVYQKQQTCTDIFSNPEFKFQMNGNYSFAKFLLGKTDSKNFLKKNSNVSIHASEEIEILGELTVPAGAELLLDSDPCY